MAMISFEQRKNDLYGLKRTKESDTLKKILTSSHVLQDGEYNFKQAELKTNTTASNDFQKQLAVQGASGLTFKEPGISQTDTHFTLGNDQDGIPKETYQISATKDDYGNKKSIKPEIMQADTSVHWPDMAPQYSTDRSLGESTYTNTFLKEGLNQRQPSFPRINTCRVNLPIIKHDERNKKDGVSVDLGNDSQNYATDYDRAYCHSAPVAGRYNPEIARKMAEAREVTQRMMTLERNSSVLRKGDYNNLGQEPGSIFTLDYGKSLETPMTGRLLIPGHKRDEDGKGDDDDDDDDINPKIPQVLGQHSQDIVAAKFKEGREGKQDHISAHFEFGTDDNKGASIYMKDYEPASRHVTTKPLIVPAPKDSAVMQSNAEYLGSNRRSTTLTEYGPKTYDMAVVANGKMINASQENLLKRFGDSVELSCDKDSYKADLRASLSHSNYVGPPKEFRALTPVKASRAPYNYLHTDVALPHPTAKHKQSEAKNQYRPYAMDEDFSLERLRQKHHNTKSRLNNGRSTHFVFGYDPFQFTSEHESNFQKRAVDKNIRPAGTTETIPDYDVSHLNSSLNTRDMAPDPYKVGIMEPVALRKQSVARSLPALPSHQASVMKNDYQDVEKRHMTPAHVVMLKKDAILTGLPASDSHLFHMDAPQNVYHNFKSTAMTDYTKPETMTGAKYLAAR